MNARSKYRGKNRNLSEPIDVDKIRSLTLEQIKEAMIGAEYVGQVLSRLGLKNVYNARMVLMKRIEDLGIPYGPVKMDSRRLLDLTGQVFGHLRVIERAESTKSGHTMWLCEETETKIIRPVASTHLIRGNTKSFSFSTPSGAAHSQWGGIGEISGNHWHSIRKKAETRKLPFEITMQYVWDLFLSQNRKCALSGIDLYFSENSRSPYTASLDRIDSSVGYVEGNVQWVHKNINIMKNRFTQESFIEFCVAVATKSGGACELK